MNNISSIISVWSGCCAVTLLVMAALLGGIFPLHGQSFAIDWFSIDGGGGRSAGIPYTVSGTLGQPDAGKMSGGNYTLDGGFGGIASVPMTGGPRTFIALSGSSAIVSWSAASGNTYRVQFKPGLEAGAWTDLSGDIIAHGPISAKVDNTLGGAAQRFYRVVLLP